MPASGPPVTVRGLTGMSGSPLARGGMTMRTLRWLALALSIGLVVAACGDDDDTTAATSATTAAAATATTAAAASGSATTAGATTPASVATGNKTVLGSGIP